MNILSFEQFIRESVKAFNWSGVGYVIVGGVLLAIYGEPRSTKDLDVIFNLDYRNDKQIERFIEVLKKHNLNIPGGAQYIIDALKGKYHFSIFNSDYIYWIDGQGVYSFWDEIVFSTRVKDRMLGVDVWVEKLEALIISKLSIYYTERGLRDVEMLIELNKDKLDKNLLLELADKMGVRTRLEKLLKSFL